MFIKYDLYLYINIHTCTILRMFKYLDTYFLNAKSIPIANKLVSLANGNKQMPIVLNYFAVFYSILIRQNKYTCQNLDQTTALMERGQNLVTKT